MEGIAKALDMRDLKPLEERIEKQNHLRLVSTNTNKTNEDVVLKRQTVGKLFLELKKIIPSLKNLEDENFKYVPQFAAKKNGYFGIDYNPYTREISGYIIDRTQPHIGLRFTGNIENQLFGRIAKNRLSSYKVIGSLEDN